MRQNCHLDDPQVIIRNCVRVCDVCDVVCMCACRTIWLEVRAPNASQSSRPAIYFASIASVCVCWFSVLNVSDDRRRPSRRRKPLHITGSPSQVRVLFCALEWARPNNSFIWSMQRRLCVVLVGRPISALLCVFASEMRAHKHTVQPTSCCRFNFRWEALRDFKLPHFEPPHCMCNSCTACIRAR